MTTNDRKYWQSLEELGQSPEFEAALEKEFPEEVESGTLDGTTRRHFLGIMGASLAMTGLSGCIRRPVQHIIPYAASPEGLLPGVPQHFATAAHVGSSVVGLLVESHEGRPTKIEGNPDHPGSMGGTSAIHQGMLLDLYDPQRMRTPSIDQGRKGVSPSDWAAVDARIRAHFKQLREQSGKGVAVLSEAFPSATYDHLRRRFRAEFPQAKWFTYEAISEDHAREGLKAAFGKPLRVDYRLNKANVVLSLDSDFLCTEGEGVANARQWATLRRLERPGDDMSRLYVVEGVYSITGTNADHRLRLRSGQVEAFAFALATAFAAKGAAIPDDILAAAKDRAGGLDDKAKKFVAAVVDDLFDRQGINGGTRQGLVIPGRRQPAVVHAITAALNHALGAQGTALYYFQDFGRPDDDLGDMAGLKALTDALEAGAVETLVVIGCNPVYSAPGDLNFMSAFSKARHRIVLADYVDETASSATVAIPKAHFLETWGDLVYADGTVAIQQPLIEPLHGAWSPIELLARTMQDEVADSYGIVRRFWEENYKQKQPSTDAFERRWRRWLHDGRAGNPFFGTHPTYVAPSGAGATLASKPHAAPSERDLEVVFLPDPNLWDGRFANNAWLQEAPDPITKITWDNAVLLSPATARALNIESENRVSLEIAGRATDLVAWIVPGQADNVAAVALGYGRNFGNFLPYHPQGVVGFDANKVRRHDQPDIASGGKVTRQTGTYLLACVQRYGRLLPEGYSERYARPHVREASLAEFEAKPNFAQPGIMEHGKPPPKATVLHPPEKSLYEAEVAAVVDYSKGPQWGMAIDLNTCTGCNACVVACVAENNIMSVGKDQVRRGREMHWIRMDRYFQGDEAEPEVVHQPMPCQQCETAPCENVCPVAATAHSPDGMNDMAYNRCIGTRYCANNCPFKVRRFNFYNFTKDQPELIHMARNPNVTVRFRGVMEKCTYCVQRVNAGKRKAKFAETPVLARAALDAVIPACGQACPAGAIVFGDINNPESAVSRAKAQARNYGLLSELNLRPRTTYLARVRNPNPKLVG